MRVLYVLSDFVRMVLYNLIGYRVSVIRKNLQNSFPEKSPEEIKAIEKEFYKHMCDLIVESIKFFTISKKQVDKMMRSHDTEILTELYNQGKDVILVGGHYASWELYALSSPHDMPHIPFALYTPLTNAWFNKKMKQTRERYGLRMQSVKELDGFFENTSGKPRSYIFGADQSPSNPKKAYWMHFLNQETGVQYGAEKVGREHNMAVVYGQLDKAGRGRYSIHYRLICTDAAKTEYGEITEKHTRWLEEHIKAKPAYWLWSHRRWKHKRPEGIEIH
jgi:KDO2-lipid IV(A) lauroyltransferase